MTELEMLQQSGYTLLKDEEALECQATLNNNSISFSLKTIANMNNPQYVLVGINESKKKFSVVSCSQDLPGARPFGTDKTPGKFTISNAKILFSKMMPDWNMDECYYKLTGKLNQSHTMAEFDLTQATPCKRRKQAKKETIQEGQAPTEEVQAAPDTISVSSPLEAE